MRQADRPTVTPPAPWTFPAASDTRLPTGLRVRTFDLPGQHVVAVRLAVPGVLQAEPADLEGVAAIMSRCLDEGTTRHTPEQLAELLEQDGIALAAGVGERGLVVELDVTGDRLEPALQILAECLTQAAFPEGEVGRAVRARHTEIEHEHADAASRAALRFQAVYWRDSERVSRPVGGRAETVAAITAADVRAFHRATVLPQAATLVVAGDFRGMPHAPDVVVQRTLSGWTGHGVASPGVDPSGGVGTATAMTGSAESDGRRAPDAARIVVVDRPGSPQTEIYLGRPGPDRRTPHGWGAYQVLAFLLGGSPQARVDAVLREERGYTYGMRVGFRPRRSGGICVVSGAVRAEATVPALQALAEVLCVTGAELGAVEVRHAADFVGRTAPGRFATADAVADQMVRLVLDELEVDTVDETLARMLTLTRDEAAAAWEDVRSGAGWTVVLVGEAEHAPVDQLEALGLGPVSVV